MKAKFRKSNNGQRSLGAYAMKLLTGLFLSLVVLSASMARAEDAAPPLVEKLYNGNWPSQEEGQNLRDELYYQRAIHAYMTMLPALNTIGMRDGSEAEFGAGYNVLPIWKDRMGADT
jgi:hypothetical protein